MKESIYTAVWRSLFTPLCKGINLHCSAEDSIYTPKQLCVDCCVKESTYNVVWRSPSKLLCKWIHLHCYVKELIYTAVWSTQSTFCVKESLYTEKSIHTPVWRNQSTLLCAWILLHWGVPLHCCVKRSIYTACLIVGLVVCYSVVALTLPQACGSGLYSADLEPPHCRSPGMILSPRICQHTVRGKKNNW